MKKMNIKDLISKDLVEMLTGCGMFSEKYFTTEKLIKADRYYLDISTDGRNISYITKDRLERFNGDFWNTELRRKFAIQTKPTRIVQHIYGETIGYSEQRKLRFMLADLSDYKVVVVKGDDIAKYYNKDNYDEIRGDLGNSCMRYCPSSFFMFYKDFCSMAVVMRLSTQKIVARAMLFHNVKSSGDYDSIDAMSRIYATDDIYYDMLKGWAFDNDYHLFNGGYDADALLYGYGDDQYISISDYKPYFEVNGILDEKYSCIPYIDNFEYSVELENGDFIITPELSYIPDEEEIENWEENHTTYGGDRWDGICGGCTFECFDCYYNTHGDSWGDDYDDEDEDCDDDDDDDGWY